VLETTLAEPRHPTQRLQSMLESRRPAIDEEILAEARAIGPGPLTELVTFLVERALRPHYGCYAAIRAVHLAGELRLDGAAPLLARCLPLRGGKSTLRQAAQAALTRLGQPGAEALLDAFERCGSMMDREELAELLVGLDTCHERVRNALLRVADDVPGHGATLLVRRGDWRAVPELMRRLDQLVLAPPDHCALCTRLDLEALESAAKTLGGIFTDEQYERFDEAVARGEEELEPWEDSLDGPPPAPAPRLVRPGRNAPCHCGSGVKYKKCCLSADERRGSH